MTGGTIPPASGPGEIYCEVENLRWRALRLAKAGFRVFPVEMVVNPDGSLRKLPCIQGYRGNEPFSSTEINNFPWHRADLLGWSVPQGHLLLDVDVKRDMRGMEHLETLQEQYGALPPTASQTTRSGGQHLDFSVDLGGRKVRSKVLLDPDTGQSADIDLVHARNRYAVLYDEQFLFGSRAALPEGWLQLVTKATTIHRQARTPGTAKSATNRDLERSHTDLAGAADHDHNNTLNRVVYDLALHGRLDPAARSVLEATATQIGLTPDEIDRTMESATGAAAAQRAKPTAWLTAVGRDDRLTGRGRPSLLMAAGQFRDLAVQHGMEVSLSVRELAEALGFTHQTAARIINRLRHLAYLERTSPRTYHNATSYRLSQPQQAKGDTPSFSLVHPVAPWGVGDAKGDTPELATSTSHGGVSLLRSSSTAELYRHDAFTLTRGARTMPKSAALVLSAVLHGASTVKTIAVSTGLSPSAVRMNLHKLESAGLLIYDSCHSRTVTATCTDPNEALDKWAQWSGAAGTGDLRRAQHQHDRQLMAWKREQWANQERLKRAPTPGGVVRFGTTRAEERERRRATEAEQQQSPQLQPEPVQAERRIPTRFGRDVPLPPYRFTPDPHE